MNRIAKRALHTGKALFTERADLIAAKIAQRLSYDRILQLCDISDMLL